MLSLDFSGCFFLKTMQVGCMTRSPVEFKDLTMIGGIIQVLNIHWGSPISEHLLLWCMMVCNC